MEDSSDSLSDLFKKPDRIRLVQNQSHVSESPVSLSSKDNSVSNVSDSGSVFSAILQKPVKCMVSSTNSVSREVSPHSTGHQNIDAEDTVVCKKKKFNFNVLQNDNCSNLFGNTPSLCESVARVQKRKKKSSKIAESKVTSLSARFSVCDTTESSLVLPKLPERLAANRTTNSMGLSLFEKTEASFLSTTFPPAYNQSMNATNGPESSVLLNKKKFTLKGSKQFSTTHLFDSEPSSVCESFTENKRKTKRFRDDSMHQQLSLKDVSECSNVSEGEKVTRKTLASVINKENVNVDFDNTVSSVSDSVIEKRGGGFLNAFKKTKNSTANATVDIFGHPEGLSDDCESSSDSEESEKDPASNTCEDESSSCREPESTNRSASTFEESSSCREQESTNKSESMDEDESSTSSRESESNDKSASFCEHESIANEDKTIQASQGDLSVTICDDQDSALSGNRSLRKSANFADRSSILADISAIERSKLTIQPTILELDENQALEISVENVLPKIDAEINDSSIDKFVLTLEMSEQQKSVELSTVERADAQKLAENSKTDSLAKDANLEHAIVEVMSTTSKSVSQVTEDPAIDNIQVSVENTENPLTHDERNVAEESSPNCEDVQKSTLEVPLPNEEDKQVSSEVPVEAPAQSTELSNVEQPIESISLPKSLEVEPKSVDEVYDPAKSIENIQMSLVEAVSVNAENLQCSLMQFSGIQDSGTNVEDFCMSISDVTLRNGEAELHTSEVAHAETTQTSSTEKSSVNMSLCKSTELEPDRICLLETRKKKRASPDTLMEVGNGDSENRDFSSMKEDQIIEIGTNVLEGVSEVKSSKSPKSIGEDLHMESCSRLLAEALCETVTVTQTDSEPPFSVQLITGDESQNLSQNRSENLPVDKTLVNDAAPAESNISKENAVEDANVSFNAVDDQNFSLAVEPGSELSLCNVTSPSTSACHSSKNNDMNRINDETRVLHSATFVTSIRNNTQNDQNNTYTVQDPVIIKDGTRMSQTLSSIFQRPRVFALSQNESDSGTVSQDSTNSDAEKNRTYTVKTLVDESSVLLPKKKAAFPELAVEDDLNMFSVNSQLLSDTVTVERRVTRSSARLSTLSAMLDESVPSQPRSSSGRRSNTSGNSLSAKNTSLPANESLSKATEVATPEAPLIEESEVEGASMAVNQSVAEASLAKSILQESEIADKSEIEKESRLSEISEPGKSQLFEESVAEEQSHAMQVSENEESEKEEESEQEESEPEESEPEESEHEESEQEESEQEEESQHADESEPMEESRRNEESMPEISHVRQMSVSEEGDRSGEPAGDEDLLAADEAESESRASVTADRLQPESPFRRASEPENADLQPAEESVNAESRPVSPGQHEQNQTGSDNFRDADESSLSSLFKRPDSVCFTRSRSRNATMSLSSSRRKSVSFVHPDCTRFTSQSTSSGSKTQTTNSSMSLVHKMCEDKSTVKGAGKMLPPKQAPKKRRKPLRFEFDSDDESADDSISKLPKKPNFPKFHPWCGKQFYSRIIEKMRPKYGLKTNSEAVRLAEYVWKSVKQVEGCRDADANHEKVEEMKRTLARKQIVVTHYNFYVFCIKNLPQRFHLKALPMGPLFPCKFDLTKWDDPILEDS